ncbi:unnamed protein product [Arctia plantaginis]|uniref:Uncharacterized protein n=1 Tax=Arctia plantaginis TaxID=874455 RepID=A0A8S0ZII0_ARCPL|nr:unnamed protein product [Arctia plantaginis]
MKLNFQNISQWEQDIEKWAGYSRQLLVRDKLRESQEMAKKAMAAKPIATLPPPRPTPSPGGIIPESLAIDSHVTDHRILVGSISTYVLRHREE